MRKMILVILTLFVISATACNNVPSTPRATQEGQEINTNNNTAELIPTEDTVIDKNVIVTVILDEQSSDIEGKYTGEFKNGKPNGEGEFISAENDNGLVYKYVGAFEDGAFNGYGAATIIVDGETLITMEGNYINGEYSPTAGQIFNLIGQTDLFGGYSLSDDIVNYIDSHKELFPTCEKATVEATDLQNFSNKQFSKTRKQEEIGLIKLKLTAQQVFEDDFLGGGKLTSMLAFDDDFNCYALYYLDTIDVYKEDTFIAYALPVARSSFENVGGGSTLVTVLLSCFIE